MLGVLSVDDLSMIAGPRSDRIDAPKLAVTYVPATETDVARATVVGWDPPCDFLPCRGGSYKP